MLKLVEPKHPALHKQATLNPFDQEINLVEFESEMFTLMHDRFGIGLSANQVGLEYNMFVMHHSTKGDIAIYNPEVLGISENKVSMEEGCLTWPVLFMNITRPASCIVRYQTTDKTVIDDELDGIDARCFLHEYDHLQGKTFLEYASDFKLQRAMKKRDKRIKEFMKAQRYHKELM